MDLSGLIGSQGTYAGIGSRRITKGSSLTMLRYACCMAFAGMVVNTGAADGSDTSFEWGARIAYDAMCDLDPNLKPGNYARVVNCFLPWPKFNGRSGGEFAGFTDYQNPKAESYTSQFHPNWAGLKPAARKMMGRNSMQVLNASLDTPVRFVACETPDAAFNASMTSSKTGGTGQAIRIADHNDVPVYNFKNPDHYARVQRWIEEFDVKVQDRYGVSPIALVDEFLGRYKGVSQSIEGDLVQETLNGRFDVLVHGCNCQLSMGSGIAKDVAEIFPEAQAANQATRKGDPKKLGGYSSAQVERNGRSIIIVNAYTQLRWGRDDVLYTDYEAVRKVFEKIAVDFKGKRIGIPRIGSGLANGCWVTVSNIISTAMKGENITLVDLPSGAQLALEKAERKKLESPQLGMGF